MTWLALGEYRGPMSARAFVRYVRARHGERERRELYRVLVTESLRAMCRGEYIEARYTDLLNQAESDDRSGDEIADSVIARAGLEVIE